tara:strand:- start:240 stop:992 length:753 start_codon:yes stop_codon:yes gene_type:complete
MVTKDNLIKYLLFILAFGPIALFYYVKWYWVVLLYNFLFSIFSYIAWKVTKNKTTGLFQVIIFPLLFNIIGLLYIIYKNDSFKKELDKIEKFSEFKRIIESKLNSNESIHIEFCMYKYDVIEKVETYDENWKGIDYTLSWDSIIKNAEFSFAEGITDFYEIIKDFSSLDELKGDDFDLIPITDGGGYSDNFKIVWQKELTHEESKQFEEYGGVQQLQRDSDKYDNVDVVKGRISSINVKIGDNENIKISA